MRVHKENCPYGAIPIYWVDPGTNVYVMDSDRTISRYSSTGRTLLPWVDGIDVDLMVTKMSNDAPLDDFDVISTIMEEDGWVMMVVTGYQKFAIMVYKSESEW